MDYPTALHLLGRILIGGIFVLAGIDHFRFFQPPLAVMKQRGVAFAAVLLVAGSLWEIALGLLVILGIGLAPAAIGLALFLIPATIIFHNFWGRTGLDRVHNLHAFMANVMIFGGLLVLSASAH